jgi:hypothetical protein
MKRYVVLGVNENPKYLYYLPLVVWAWGELGWWPVIMFTGKQSKITDFVFNEREGFIYDVGEIEDYKSETIAQVSRLYAGCFIHDGYLMTSDVDMLPLSDYWFANISTIDCYGRDLTDYHYPICYIGAEAYLWQKVMRLAYAGDPYVTFTQFIKNDLRKQKNMWTLDQDIITERLLAYGKDKIVHENRGTDKRTGYPLGRVDRSNWTLDHKQLIDAHLPHDILTNDKSFHKVMELLHHVWPQENFKWFLEYHKEFKKLL